MSTGKVNALVAALVEARTASHPVAPMDSQAVMGPAKPPEQEMPNVPARGTRENIKTVRLDARDFQASWPMALASLEKIAGWGTLALRLGTLALIQECVRELAFEEARADTLVRLRALTDALAHMPLET